MYIVSYIIVYKAPKTTKCETIHQGFKLKKTNSFIHDITVKE